MKGGHADDAIFLQSPEEVSHLDKNLLANLRERNAANPDWGWQHAKTFGYEIKDHEGNRIAGISALARGRWLIINILWVHEDNRKHGVGSSLVRQVLEDGRRRECHSAAVETYEWEAPNFYKRHGFLEAFRFDNIFNGYDRILLVRKL